MIRRSLLSAAFARQRLLGVRTATIVPRKNGILGAAASTTVRTLASGKKDGGTEEQSLFHPAQPWQAEHNIDIQRVTQQALIHELTQQQTRTIEHVVPWFLNNMPAPYFRQVPESFRRDHIKAISAVKEANMERKFFCKNIYI
jgi:hypothetical protein